MSFVRRVAMVVGSFALLAGGFLFVGAPGAGADGNAHPGAYAGWVRSYGMPSIYRSDRYGCGPRGPAAIDRPWCGCDVVRDPCHAWRGAYGTPWSVMRRYLATDPYRAPRHRHPSHWWLRRWPCATTTAPGWGEHRCAGTEVGPEECAFAKAALDEASAGDALTAEDRLVRGLERFHAGAFDRAAEDFRVASDADPKDGRAAYGRLMCAFVAKDWPATADALRRLAAIGALDARDRWEENGGLEDRRRLTNLADAVVAHVSWNVHDANARLVAAWALAADGRPEPARPHARAALRSNEGDPAAAKIVADLAGPSPVAPPAPSPAEEGSRPDPGAEVARAVSR